mmetsp:Transcript_37648/g.69572  ORF Transcript_37648/g.69572 Transcript_37648/m.69572 type:complete len:189 (-) Transcript_37648:425-991(-)
MNAAPSTSGGGAKSESGSKLLGEHGVGVGAECFASRYEAPSAHIQMDDVVHAHFGWDDCLPEATELCGEMVLWQLVLFRGLVLSYDQTVHERLHGWLFKCAPSRILFVSSRRAASVTNCPKNTLRHSSHSVHLLGSFVFNSISYVFQPVSSRRRVGQTQRGHRGRNRGTASRSPLYIAARETDVALRN